MTDIYYESDVTSAYHKMKCTFTVQNDLRDYLMLTNCLKHSHIKKEMDTVEIP